MVNAVGGNLTARAPDAMQRAAFWRRDASQSRGPCLVRMLGPGSAQQRYALQRVRDTGAY